VKRIAAGAFALVLLATTAGAWQGLSPEGAGFEAVLPGEPVYETSRSSTPVGRVVEHMYRLEGEAASFWITWTELPRAALWFQSRDGILERVRRSYADRDELQAGSFEAVSLGDHAGRELAYRENASSAEGRVRTFLVGRRLYIFDAAWTSPGRAQVERFFDSLQIQAP